MTFFISNILQLKKFTPSFYNFPNRELLYMQGGATESIV